MDDPIIYFDKMSGSGNDFIIIDNRRGLVPEDLLPKLIVKGCRRRLSVGADGLILIEKSQTKDFKWRFFNADGSVAEMCGNGARCAARFAWQHGIAGEKMTFETVAGIVEAEIIDDRVKLQMTKPGPLMPPRQLVLSSGVVTAWSVNTGVPHAVVEVQDLQAVDVYGMGREIRHHEAFSPAGTNANFIQVLKDGVVGIRTYERGVEDETLACGTGAVAAAIVMAIAKDFPQPVRMRPQGGGLLTVHLEGDGKSVQSAFLEGDARLIYSGTLQPDAWEYE
jgi:diaminopimelate epimerase